jgi:hypothetical protein
LLILKKNLSGYLLRISILIKIKLSDYLINNSVDLFAHPNDEKTEELNLKTLSK